MNRVALQANIEQSVINAQPSETFQTELVRHRRLVSQSMNQRKFASTNTKTREEK